MKKRYLLILLPLLFSDVPYVVLYQQKLYFPILFDYLETDFGGISSLLMDYQYLDAWILKAPFPGLTPDFSLSHPFSAPSSKHWLGTNAIGQDILAYAVHALFSTGLLSLALTSISYFAGLTIGAYFALSQRTTESIGQIALEVCRSIPFALVLVLSSDNTLWLFFCLFTLTQWTKFAYLSRNHIHTLQSKPFFLDTVFQSPSRYQQLSATLPSAYHATKSLLPHTFLNYLAILTSLDYFSLSLFPSYPSLGKLIFQAQQSPHALSLLFACGLIFTIVSILAIKKGR